MNNAEYLFASSCRMALTSLGVKRTVQPTFAVEQSSPRIAPRVLRVQQGHEPRPSACRGMLNSECFRPFQLSLTSAAVARRPQRTSIDIAIIARTRDVKVTFIEEMQHTEFPGCLRFSFTRNKLEKSRKPSSSACACLCHDWNGNRGNPWQS